MSKFNVKGPHGQYSDMWKIPAQTLAEQNNQNAEIERLRIKNERMMELLKRAQTMVDPRSELRSDIDAELRRK